MDYPVYKHEQLLRAIGLTPIAARCYLHLAIHLPDKRPLWAMDICRELGLGPATAYRALNELHQKGFIRKSRVYAHTSYWAEPITHALDNLALHWRELAEPVLRLQRERQEQFFSLGREWWDLPENKNT